MTTGDPLETFRPDIPSPARIYDYFLGGKDNYPSDRKAAEKIISVMPPGVVRGAVLANRKFLGRVVRYLVAEAGIRQFLDIGTGLPTMGNVHEVAQGIADETRIVYVDNDPIVIAHARAMLHAIDHTAIVSHDLRDPEGILADEELRAVLDFTEPVAVLLVAVLHFISDSEHPRRIIKTIMDAVPSGSYLAISHVTADTIDEMDDAVKVYDQATSRAFNRTRAEVAAFFDGLDLMEPGICWVTDWRPDPEIGAAVGPGKSLIWCGVGRKP
jgi:hypothetical protein